LNEWLQIGILYLNDFFLNYFLSSLIWPFLKYQEAPVILHAYFTVQ
jgi:hypothetical protein